MLAGMAFRLLVNLASENRTDVERIAWPSAQQSEASALPAVGKVASPRKERVDIVSLVQQRLSDWRQEAERDVKDRLMHELIAILNNDNAGEIFQSLSAEDANDSFGVEALQRWLASNPVAAADWIATRSETSAGQAALVANKLLENLDTFEDYLKRLPAGEWKENVLSAAGFQIVSVKPTDAIGFARRMNAGEIQTALLQFSVFEWARSEPEAVMEWTGQVDEPELRERLSAWAAKGVAESNPRQAVEWLVSTVNSEEALRDAGQSIVRSWVVSDPAAAADWVVLFPEGPVRDEALETLMSFWAASDLSAASAWVEQLAEGSLRRNALSILTRESWTAAM
jgi:hypothetical protein